MLHRTLPILTSGYLSNMYDLPQGVGRAPLDMQPPLSDTELGNTSDAVPILPTAGPSGPPSYSTPPASTSGGPPVASYANGAAAGAPTGMSPPGSGPASGPSANFFAVSTSPVRSGHVPCRGIQRGYGVVLFWQTCPFRLRVRLLLACLCGEGKGMTRPLRSIPA